MRRYLSICGYIVLIISSAFCQESRDSLNVNKEFADSCTQAMGLDLIDSNVADLIVANKEIVKKDSIINELQATINLQRHHLLFADSVILRLANDCFRFKYSKVNVDNAKNNFASMYSPQLQKQFRPLMDLLNNYGILYAEVEGVLLEAQENFDRKTRLWKNPFDKNEQSPNRVFINKLKDTRYYREIYKHDWSIYYLDDLIDKAINQMKEFENNARNAELNLKKLL